MACAMPDACTIGEPYISSCNLNAYEPHIVIMIIKDINTISLKRSETKIKVM